MTYQRYRPRRPRRSLGWGLIVAGLLAMGLVAAGLAYNMPAIRWRAQMARSAVRDRFFPPALTLPTPALVTGAPTFHAPTQTPAPSPTGAAPAASPTAQITEPQATRLRPEATPTTLPTIAAQLPPAAALTGVVHEYQGWNNCGPATLAMSLSYWGWSGSQADTAAFLKPNPDDRNVMPYEMADYVERVGLTALIRQGGDLATVKRFVANGFPVITEKTFWVDEERGWMGHYVLITGYDDEAGVVIAQDSFNGPNRPYPYNELLSDWRGFNYVYVVAFPPERLAEVTALLGPDADEHQNVLNALALAQAETGRSLTNQDKAFAWFNVGTNYNLLGRYEEAAAAFDQARVLGLPWRMLWYQTGPYRAYYQVGRYDDVITLANTTIGDALGVLEESHYWRGYARQALGDNEAALADWRIALEFNANFAPAREALTLSGATP